MAHVDSSSGPNLSDQRGEPTGRYVVVFSDALHGDPGAMSEQLQSVPGVSSVASSRDFDGGAVDLTQAASADGIVFADLGVAVVQVGPDQALSVDAAASDPAIIAIEPERTFYAIDESGVPLDYVRGYRDGVSDLYRHLSGDESALPGTDLTGRYADNATFTWGVQATRASTSSRTGQGVSVAVLDTGLDLSHPDFAGRRITAQSFVAGLPPADGHGHGTHCVGTACGSARPTGTRRYGVAPGAAIFVGKVLTNQGSGTDTNILAGMNWAIASRCRVVSMSLGASLAQVSTAYETVGRRALAAGTLVVAAAGNNADRRIGNFGFVGVPANSPSIMAVAAVDPQLAIAAFSARSNPVQGGQVDVAAPGVAVYSSWPMPSRYNTISGTSMATPHVAGLAALWSQANGATGTALWSALTQAARRLSLPSVDVGTGLAQAPQ